ncbi:MAG: hypothetical protein D3916_05025, partial [Candidatus Electrothrix sp. MAN1_4]|nr:hypothetical protein [Candidatus Electrothrix sp. MAN1_4]
MTLALAVCLAFLFAIFFGAVALFDREAAAKMFQNLQESLPGWVPSLPQGCCTSCTSPAQSSLEAAETAAHQERYETLHGEINGVQEHLHTTRDILSNTIDQLTARIEKLEDMTANMVSQQQLNDVSHKVLDAVDSLDGIQNAVSAMQNSINQTASQVQDISPESVLKDLPQRVQTLEEQKNNTESPEITEVPEPVDITPLQNDIKAMQKELNQVKERANQALQAATEQAVTSGVQEPAQESVEKAVAQEQPAEQPAQESTAQATPSPQQEQEESEHRIFSYFDLAWHNGEPGVLFIDAANPPTPDT